ncbi:MAG: hypothetical protein R3F14_07920 [Polyangiaceae bacterium]
MSVSVSSLSGAALAAPAADLGVSIPALFGGVVYDSAQYTFTVSNTGTATRRAWC